MINADVDGMKRHADAMNVGHVFGLFACMLSARSWKALQAGIGKYEFSEAEVGVLLVFFVLPARFEVVWAKVFKTANSGKEGLGVQT